MKHARRRVESEESFGLRDTLIWCGIPIVIVLLVRMFLFGFYVIPSGSMLNTIEPGDRVITSKLTPKVFKLQRGDVVVFKDPDHWLQQENSGRFGGDYLIKRLIGLPGDTVACEGPGKPVTVNGVAIDETSYIRSGVDPSSFAFSEKVTAGHVFVMGDNRANSADSRYHQDDACPGSQLKDATQHGNQAVAQTLQRIPVQEDAAQERVTPEYHTKIQHRHIDDLCFRSADK